MWFKHDLRVDDHPGLLAASKHRAVIPLYVLDRRILSSKFIYIPNVGLISGTNSNLPELNSDLSS